MSDQRSAAHDADEHLDLEHLADVLAGGGTAPGQAHLESCPACAGELARLQEALPPVTAALESLPEPEQPADFGAQLSRAISQERVRLRLDRKPSRPASGASTVTPGRAKRAGGWRSIGPALAAAAALVLVGVLLFRGGSGSGHSGTTANSPAETHTLSSGVNYRKELFAAALPALLKGSTSELSTQVGGEKASAPRPQTAPLASAASDPLARLRITSALASCVVALSDPQDSRPPLAIDYAQFQGQPALVVVLPTEKADKVDVFVVGPGCAPADAQVLFFTRLTRPA